MEGCIDYILDECAMCSAECSSKENQVIVKFSLPFSLELSAITGQNYLSIIHHHYGAHRTLKLYKTFSVWEGGQLSLGSVEALNIIAGKT